MADYEPQKTMRSAAAIEMKEHTLATIDTKARDKHTTEAAIWLGELEDAYALLLEAKRKKGSSASASSSS